MITYTDAVAEARQLVKRSEEDQWRLAELTWEQVETGKSQRQWAKDIGVSPSHSRYLYKVWAEFGAHRDAQSFAEAYNAMLGRDSDVEEHGSQYAANAARAIRNMPPERKAEMAAELLAEPEVAAQVIDDPKARATVRHALDERYDSLPKPYEGRIEKAPHDHAIEVLVRLRGISAAIKAATDVILSGPQLDGADDLLAVVDWQANALNIIRTALTGRSDMDAELAKILESGS